MHKGLACASQKKSMPHDLYFMVESMTLNHIGNRLDI